MTKPRAYVESSIPSFYYEQRPAAKIVAQREWTRQWWSQAPDRFELVTSPAVLDELSRGIPERGSERISLMEHVPILPIVPAIDEIVRTYLKHKLMPQDPTGDALHLAVASLHKCDFLVTWNCRHLANANKFGHIRRINTMLGCSCPRS